MIAAASRGLWSVAGMDLVLLAGAVVAGWAALRLEKTAQAEREIRIAGAGVHAPQAPAE